MLASCQVKPSRPPEPCRARRRSPSLRRISSSLTLLKGACMPSPCTRTRDRPVQPGPGCGMVTRGWESGKGGFRSSPRTPRGRRDPEVYRGAHRRRGEDPRRHETHVREVGLWRWSRGGLELAMGQQVGPDAWGGPGVRSALPGGGSAEGLAEEGEPLDGHEKQDSDGVKDRAREACRKRKAAARRG